MEFGLLVPITAFICIVMAIKVIVEARLRSRMAETNASEDLVKSMLVADEQSRRLSALKWGLVLTVIGLAFGLISALKLDSQDPGTWGLLIGAAGIGMLAYHAIASRDDLAMPASASSSSHHGSTSSVWRRGAIS